MIPKDAEILVALEPVNMHLSFDRLAGLASEWMMGEVRTGKTLCLFFNRRRTRLKALFYDGTGLCLFYKRLDRGRFQLPTEQTDEQGNSVVELTDAALEQLLDGLALEPGDWTRKPTIH